MDDFDLTGEVSDQYVCEDLLLAILEEMPSRSLVPLRVVSRLFAILVDEILCARFLNIAAGDKHELILESCAPCEIRTPYRQRLAFSHFVELDDPFASKIAHFAVTAQRSLFLPLDDDEIFGNNLLGIHLQNTVQPILARAHPDDGTSNLSFVHLATPTPAAPARSRPPSISWSLSLASSLDRLFRDWFFLEPSSVSSSSSPHSSLASTPTSSLSCSPAVSRPPSPSSPCPSPLPELRPTRTQLLSASPSSAASALRGAYIECIQQPRPASEDEYRRSPSPKLFEYCFSSVRLEVGKVVVAAEEGLTNGGRGNPFVLVL
ncbi:hypothetical protein JCM21900_000537 [Sporobolomyces salmonicolor]